MATCACASTESIASPSKAVRAGMPQRVQPVPRSEGYFFMNDEPLRDYSPQTAEQRISAIVKSIFTDIACARSVALVAEPGMGKTYTCQLLLSQFNRQGGTSASLYCDTLEGSPSEISDTIIRFVQDQSNSQDSPNLLFVDAIPPFVASDERRFVRQCLRAADKGIALLLTMRPEAAGFVQQLPFCIKIYGRQLMVQRDDFVSWGAPISAMKVSTVSAYTHLIPALMCDLSVATVSEGGSAGPIYTPASHGLQKLVHDTLRDTLPADWLLVRATLMLLGSGTFSQVSQFLPELPFDTILNAVSDAPFFSSLTQHAGRFSCARLSDPESFIACIGECKHHLKNKEKLIFTIVQYLTDHHEYLRAATIMRTFSSKDLLYDYTFRHPLALLSQGNKSLLSEALCWKDLQGAHAIDSNIPEESLCLTRAALAAMEGDSQVLSKQLQALPTELSAEYQDMRNQVLYLAAAQQLSSGMASEVPVLKSTSETSDQLELHAEALAHFAQGDAHWVYNHTLPYANPADTHALPQVLLSSDFALAQTLVGDKTMSAPGIEHAFHLCSNSGITQLTAQQYLRQQLVRLVNDLYAGSSAADGIEHSDSPERLIEAAQASRLGLIASFFAFVGALQDLTCSLYLRCCVRSRRAIQLARQCQCTFIQNAAQLIFSIASQALHEPLDKVIAGISSDTEPTSLNAAWWLCVAVLRGNKSMLEAPHRLAHTKFPRQALPWLALLLSDCGQYSENLLCALPSHWRHELERWLSRQRPAQKPISPQILPAPQKNSAHVHLLGAFEVERDGVRISQRSWKRQPAKLLVALLAATPGHSMSRERLVRAIWGVSYLEGSSRLYVTLSAARQALGEEKGTQQKIASGGGNIWFVSGAVTCDIDELEAAMQHALDSNCTPAETVSRVLVVHNLYVGDLCLLDAETNILERRQRELKRRFADVLVVGARAALACDSPVRARWFAQQALEHGAGREDAAYLNIESLFLQGRTSEASAAYEAYARETIASTGRPPQLAMRQMVARHREGEGAFGAGDLPQMPSREARATLQVERKDGQEEPPFASLS